MLIWSMHALCSRNEPQVKTRTTFFATGTLDLMTVQTSLGNNLPFSSGGGELFPAFQFL